jgi:FAD/FMN-containing dehydrogenase
MIESELEALRADLAGDLIVPGHPQYDEARAVFNAMVDRRPAAIARCASTADVVSAVAWGRANGLELAVRCGGHSVAGLGTCDGLVIDLSGLGRIEVDPERRIARVGGGVLWGELDRATAEHGLHTPGGRVTTTGVGGFTTGGGYGWTSSKHGLACDNLVSAEVVTADGRVLSASETENADLFWAVRGGGGNFGVVTRFDFRLHPIGPVVLAGLALWPLEEAPTVLRVWRDYVDEAVDELSTAVVVLTAPPEEPVPAELRGRPVVGMAVLYVGEPDVGASVIAPLLEVPPAVDLVQPMPYPVFQGLLDASAPHGKRSYWRGEYIEILDDAALDVFVERAPQLVAAGPPFSQATVFRIGQGVTAVPDADTAFSHRDARYLFHPIAMWERPEDDERMIAEARGLADAMRPFGTGAAYLNFTPEADRVQDAFGAEKLARLTAVKRRYDPDNVFRGNQNIAPREEAPRESVTA